MRTKTRDPIPMLQAKCGEYADLPVAEWSHYHLLGYLMAKTGTSLPPLCEYGIKHTEPSRHDWLQNMRNVLRAWGNDSETCKGYLDFLLSRGHQKPTTGSVESYRRSLAKRGDGTASKQHKQSLSVGFTINRSDPLPEDLGGQYPNIPTFGELAFRHSAGLVEVSSDVADILRRVV